MQLAYGFKTNEDFKKAYELLKANPELFGRVVTNIDTHKEDDVYSRLAFLKWMRANKKFEEAVRVFKTLFELDIPPKLLAAVHCDYADMLMNNIGAPKEAKYHYILAIKLAKENGEYYFDYVFFLMKVHKYNKATRILNKLSRMLDKIDPETLEVDKYLIRWFNQTVVPLHKAFSLVYYKEKAKGFIIDIILKRVIRQLKRKDFPKKLAGDKIGLFAVVFFLRGLNELRRKYPRPKRALYYLKEAERLMLKCEDGESSSFLLDEDVKIAIQQNLSVAYWRCGFVGLACEEIDKVLEKNFENIAAQRLKKALEDVKSGAYKPPFPMLRGRVWFFACLVVVWLGFLLLPLIGVNFTSIKPTFDLIKILVVASLLLAGGAIVYPLIRFIRRMNIPGAGDASLAPFLADIHSEILRSFSFFPPSLED